MSKTDGAYSSFWQKDLNKYIIYVKNYAICSKDYKVWKKEYKYTRQIKLVISIKYQSGYSKKN